MPGAEKLRDCALLEKMTRAQRDSGKMYAAICATPAVFFEVKIALTCLGSLSPDECHFEIAN